MWLTVVLLCSCLWLSREHICTEISRFPQLKKNYTVVGQPVEIVAVGGLLDCLLQCQLKATCEAFTYNIETRECKMYNEFEFSSPNSITDKGVLTSIISDWNRVKNYTIGRVNQVLVPGHECYIRGTEQLLLNGTAVKRRPFYNGTLNVTPSGRECQKWISHTPHGHSSRGSVSEHFATGESMEEVSNYCRIVLPDPTDTPWCYTTDPGKRWEKCNVTRCK